MKAEGAFRVTVDDYVKADGGTGVVHNAPAFGEDDMRICLAQGDSRLPAMLVIIAEIFSYDEKSSWVGRDAFHIRVHLRETRLNTCGLQTGTRRTTSHIISYPTCMHACIGNVIWNDCYAIRF